MSDQIIIKDLEIYSNHGVYKEEKTLGQKFLVSATLETNTKKAGKTDDLNLSVNYGTVCHRIAEIMEQHTFDLIETVAETVSRNLLLEFPLVSKMTIEVKKPWAPIGMPLSSVAVQITRQWQKAYIGIGSNMGNRERYIKDAIRALEDEDDIRGIKASSFIETKPYGPVEQDDFLNGCIAIETLKDPEELLEFLMKVEQKAKRERSIHWGPRTLDLDILLYGDVVMNREELTIPHIEMHKRMFVLKPLSEIAPYEEHPVMKKSIMELKEILEKETNTCES